MPRNCGALLKGVLARRGERSKVFIADTSITKCVDPCLIVRQGTSVVKARRGVSQMAANGSLRPPKSSRFGASERPVSVRTDIRCFRGNIPRNYFKFRD